MHTHLQRHPHAWGTALALLGAIGFSGKAIVVKLGYQHGADPSTLLALRMMLAAPFFALALWVQDWLERKKRQPNSSPSNSSPSNSSPSNSSTQHRPLTGRNVATLMCAGLLGYYGASILDFMGLQYISSSLERLILFTYPSLVLCMHAAIHRCWPPRHQLLCMGLSYAGLLVVYSHENLSLGPQVGIGAALVFASAVCYAGYMVLSERLVASIGTVRMAAWAALVSTVAIGVHVAAQGQWATLLQQPLPVWGWSAVNALLCTVVPVFCVTLAIQLMGASKTTQLGMVGPVATMGLAALVLSEPITLWHLLGTALVLLGTVLTAKTNAPALSARK